MFWLSLAALAAAWLLQQLDARPLLDVPAPAWVAVAVLLRCLVGARAALILLAAAWALCRAGWQFEGRLPEYLANRDVVVRGVVCDFPRADAEAVRLMLEREPDAGLAGVPERIHLSWYEHPPALEPGQRWQLRVRLKPPRGLANPGGFDFEQWLYLRGIGASGYVRPSRLNRPLPARWAACPVGSVRGFLARRMEEALGAHPAAGYVLGVAVGATHRLTEADWNILRRTGTTHLLAISGMNIAMVAAPFMLFGPLLARLWPRLAGRLFPGLLPALLAATVYTALAGFAVSTVRALVMLTVAAALRLCRRRTGGGDVLGAAALVVLVIDPPAVVSASFWLSFLAVAWLYLATAPQDRATPAPHATPAWWRRLAAAGVTLTRAQLVLGVGLAPITLAWFRQVSLIAPLTNLVAVPVFSVAIMPLSLAGVALVAPFPRAGGVLLRLAADVAAMLVALLRYAADAAYSVWEPPYTANAVLAVAAGGAVVLCWRRPVPVRMLALGLLLPALVGIPAAGVQLRVTVMDVGQGLAVLVQTARHALLYDAGPAYRLRDAGESVVLPVLRRAGVARLDAVVISHDDQDHRGGIASVLAVHRRTLVIAPQRSMLALHATGSCTAGLAWEWDGVRFRVLSPAAPGKSDNDDSCVLRIEAPHGSVLLPGDIERRREEELARRGVLRPADLVLAPHHGSRSSSSGSFVRATHPRFVVFSTGYLNRWGFPAAEVVRRWREAGACQLDTATAGAIVFTTGGDGSLRLERRERVDGAHLWSHATGAKITCALPGAG